MSIRKSVVATIIVLAIIVIAAYGPFSLGGGNTRGGDESGFRSLDARTYVTLEWSAGLRSSDVSKLSNTGSEERLLPQVPIKKAGIFPSNLRYDQPIKSNFLNLGHVTERVSYVVQSAIMAFNLRRIGLS